MLSTRGNSIHHLRLLSNQNVRKTNSDRTPHIGHVTPLGYHN